jgi:membrane protein
MFSLAGVIKDSVTAFIDDDALSRGASIAFYAVTSMAPVMVIVVAIAGAVFGETAAQGALAAQLMHVIGAENADFVQQVVAHAAEHGTSTLAGLVGTIALIVSASGVFGEVQATLNIIWKATPHRTTLRRLIRARLLSLLLVAGLGCLLLLSLCLSAGMALLNRSFAHAPIGWVLPAASFVVSFVLLAAMIAAIYKVLPDAEIGWHCVLVGGAVTAFLFEIGKFLIGLYLAKVAVATAYGAAGSLLVLLLWTYYSAQIFLLGAEFTKAYAAQRPDAAHR